MSGDAKTRYCAFCGYPYQEYETTCGSCGRTLPYVAPTGERAAAPPPEAQPLAPRPQPQPSYPPPGGDAPPSRGGIPGWALGVIGCAVLTPILVVGIVVVAAVASAPSSQTPARKVATADENLRKIWAAQEAYVARTGSDYLEFSITTYDQADPEYRKLGLSLGTLHHDYDAFYDGDDRFWITAIGNVDFDTFEDEWELSEDTGEPDHYANDLTDTYIEADEEEEEYVEEEYEEEEPAGVLGQVKTEIELTDTRAQTARANLEAIWLKEKVYKSKKKVFLAFPKATKATWTALGVALPEAEHHTYTATVAGGKLTLAAEGNLDADEFVDRWVLDGTTGLVKQVKNDALNLDFTALQAGK